MDKFSSPLTITEFIFWATRNNYLTLETYQTYPATPPGQTPQAYTHITALSPHGHILTVVALNQELISCDYLKEWAI